MDMYLLTAKDLLTLVPLYKSGNEIIVKIHFPRNGGMKGSYHVHRLYDLLELEKLMRDYEMKKIYVQMEALFFCIEFSANLGPHIVFIMFDCSPPPSKRVKTMRFRPINSTCGPVNLDGPNEGRSFFDTLAASAVTDLLDRSTCEVQRLTQL
jgi:hypothetical protein